MGCRSPASQLLTCRTFVRAGGRARAARGGAARRYHDLLAPFAETSHTDARLTEAEDRNLHLYGYGVKGFTQHNATYWVGANALLRHTALKEIAVREVERGYPVQRFIQDRTVIEDTESSVDLSVRGWRLYNYPERLAYSATPPDFGSLIIQRRRWANGGLIILP